MTIDPHDVKISVSAALNDDVENGLRLYGIENGILGPNDAGRAALWADRLFRRNPSGQGLFVTAHHNGRLVGFVSMIDLPLVFKGLHRRSGKVEFWVVDKDYRKVFPPESGVRLPWALFRTLRSNAADFGYDVSLTVSRQAAPHLRREGDLRITTSLDCYAAGRDVIDALPNWITLAYQVDEMYALVDQPSNCLVSSAPEVMSFRFPGDLKLLIPNGHDSQTCLLVFRLTDERVLTLVHWSKLPTLIETFVAALKMAVETTKADAVLIEIPAEENNPIRALSKLGFSSTSRLASDCFLFDTKKSLQLEEARHWHFTHAHTRLYQAIK